MRAGEEFTVELSDLGGSYVGGRYGNTAWTRSSGRSSAGAGRVAAEAEDALAPNNSPRGHARSRSGMYYSPPGTSYMIVERPSSAMHHTSSRDYNLYPSQGTFSATTTSPRGEDDLNK